jgi:hypothetical protein
VWRRRRLPRPPRDPPLRRGPVGLPVARCRLGEQQRRRRLQIQQHRRRQRERERASAAGTRVRRVYRERQERRVRVDDRVLPAPSSSAAVSYPPPPIAGTAIPSRPDTTCCYLPVVLGHPIPIPLHLHGQATDRLAAPTQSKFGDTMQLASGAARSQFLGFFLAGLAV